jgi:signal transduction histidine kinase/ligand-binding sensor domain-containing protein/CheY-like chemotaxis protein
MFRQLTLSVLILACACTLSVRSQSTLNFDRIGIDQGLSSSIVTKIIQDKDGYMWIATRDGLNRYNGYFFQTYNYHSGDLTSLSGNLVYDVFEDRNGTIWAATSNGVSRFNRLKNCFSQFRHSKDSSSLNSNEILSIAQDKDGGLWFATADAGLNYCEDASADTLRFRHFYSSADKNSLHSNHLWKIFFDSSGKGWVGSQQGVCCVTKNASGHFSFDRMESAPDLKNRNDVWNIFEDNKKNIWLVSFTGLLDIIPAAECEKKLCDVRVIHALDYINKTAASKITTLLTITQDKNGFTWLGTSGSGLARFKATVAGNELVITDFLQCKKEWNRNHSIGDNTVYSICNDAAGNFWIGTDNGLSVYRPEKENFNMLPLEYFFPELGETAVTSITGNKAYTFIGTAGKGVIVLDNASQKLFRLNTEKQPEITSAAVYALLADKKNNLWIGTSDGLYKIRLADISPDGKSGKVESYLSGNDEHSLYSRNVFSLCESENGKIFIGTGMGLNAYDANLDKIIRLPRAGMSNEIVDENISRFILEDKSERIWIGTDDGLLGFDKLLGRSKKVAGIAEGIKINCLFEGMNGSVLIGTNGSGLIHFDAATKKVITYSAANGLPSDVVVSMQKDTDGNLWIATHKGLSKFSGNNFVNYDFHDGLYSNEFMGGSFLAPDGKLYFGNSKGLNAFYPNHIRRNTFIAPLALTDFKINDHSVFEDADTSLRSGLMNGNSVTLSFKQNNFAFEFAALNYMSPEKNQYAFMLEEYDKDWVNNGNRRYRNYTNIEPGNYTLKVKASNSNGTWDDNAVAYKITILPPFYRTWWFRILFLVVLSALVLLFNRARIKTIQLEKEREFAVKATHMKEQFLANMSHEIRTPLNAIIGMTRLLKDKEPKPAQEKYLNAIMQSSDNLLVIINDILDISKIEAGKVQLEKIPFSVHSTLESVYNMLRFKAEEKGLDFSYKVTADVPQLVLGDPVRLSQKLINLTGNAIKFTEKGSVSMNCEVIINDDASKSVTSHVDNGISLKFDVTDTGVGIAAENQNKIFESFTQENSTVTRKFGGTGLGLAITKKLVEMQGGNIYIKSRQGEGTTFSLTIPYEVSKEKPGSKTAHVSLDAAKLLLKNCSVLLAEDNEFNQIVAIDTLEQEIEGVKIDVAQNGREAIEKIQVKQYDVVLMDVQMPEMNGYDATREIRLLPFPKSKTYIIAMTASALKEEVKRCYDAGMDEYVAKPFNKEELILKMAGVKA